MALGGKNFVWRKGYRLAFGERGIVLLPRRRNGWIVDPLDRHWIEPFRLQSKIHANAVQDYRLQKPKRVD